MVRVDKLQVHGNAWGPFLGGSCHLTADSLEELHAFADRLGLQRVWFQDHRTLPHYDLTKRRRVKAVALGAVEVTTREQIAAWREAVRLREEGKAGI